MRRKKRTQPEVFWNLNNKPRRTKAIKAPQKIVLVQPIPKNNNNKSSIFGSKLKKQRSFAPNARKQKWNINSKPFKITMSKAPKIKSQRNAMGAVSFVPKKPTTVPANYFMPNNLVPKNNHNHLSYLNGAAAIANKPASPATVDSIFPIIKMTPAVFLRKERITDKNLIPWGDADMDGSVNHMDCNPRDPSQDGILDSIRGFGRKVSELVTGRKRYSEEAFSKRTPQQEEKVRVQLMKEDEGLSPGEFEKKVEKEKEKFKKRQEEEEPTTEKEYVGDYKKDTQQLDEVLQEEAQRKSIKELKEEDKGEREDIANLAEERARMIARKERRKLSEAEISKIRGAAAFSKAREQDKRTPDVVTRTGAFSGEGKGIIKRGGWTAKAIYPVQKSLEKLKRVGGAITEDTKVVFGDPRGQRLQNLNKEIENLQKQGKSTAKLREIREDLKSKIKIKKTKVVGGILSAVTPLGAVPEIHKAASASVSSKATKTGKKGRGRPKGSFKGGYSVDGETLSEAQFQQLRSVENKRRKAMNMQKIPSGARQFNQVKQAVQRVETPQAVEEYEGEEVPQEYRMQEGEAVPQEQQQRRPRTIEEKQQVEQQSDNVLNAPSIMGGELKNTGGILTPVGPSILDAPNVFKGGLRNVDQEGEVPSVTLGERPNPNPYGTEYTEAEPGTGRMIVKRRPQEKWATGEAV